MLNLSVGNGSVCYSEVDYSLPGFVPFEFERNYNSSKDLCGYMGWNWSTPLDIALVQKSDTFFYRDQWSSLHALALTKGNEAKTNSYTIRKSGRHLVATIPGLLAVYFAEGLDAYVPVQLQDLNGNSISLDYGHKGLVDLVTDSMGRRIAVHTWGSRINEFELLPRNSNTKGVSLSRYTYSNNGDLTTVIDGNGHAAYFEYEKHKVVHFRNRKGGSQFAAYDEKGRCTSLWCTGNQQLRTVNYDDVRRSVLVADSRGASTVYRCSKAGFVTEEVNVLGIVSSNVISSSNGQLGSLDNTGKPKLTTLYDECTGKLTVTDAVGATSIFEDDEYGSLAQMTDATGAKWRWSYDALGRVEKTIRPLGATVQFTYDQKGFVVSRTDAHGHVITQSRADDGRRVNIADSFGTVLEYHYDELGRFIGSADALGQLSWLDLDVSGRVLRCTWPDHSEVQYSYDSAGNLVAVTDEIGNRSSFDFDLFGRCIKYTDAQSNATIFDYDLEGALTGITDAKGQSHNFEYDLLGRVVGQEFVDGTRENYRYDAHGNLVEVIQGDQSKISIVFSPVGRITRKNYSDKESDSFSYDPIRRMVFASNNEASISLKWNLDGNLVEECQNDFKLRHSYDVVGNRVNTRDSEGHLTSYVYDLRRRLTSIQSSTLGTHSFEYDTGDLLRKHVYPNGAIVSFSYDARRRMIGQTLSGINGTELSGSYKFDAANRLIYQQTIGGRAEQVSYDPCDRVLKLDPAGGVEERYEYDALGNLTAAPGGRRLIYGHGNLLVLDGITQFSYDKRGNLERQEIQDSCRQFVYNVAGRLTKILEDDVVLASFAYDPLGRRTTRASGTNATTFNWDGFTPVREVEPAGETRVLFDHTRNLPLTRANTDYVDHYVTDRRGCVSAIISESGTLVGTNQFDVFGALRGQPEASSRFPYRLRGQYFDQDSGLHYNFQRYYQPSTGRFVSRDPFGVSSGLNTYAYGPNTLTWEDPFGLTGECQGDVFYRAMSDKEKQKVLADCQLHAKKSKCPEGPYVTQTRAYCESATREKPDDYKHLAEICTQPGTAQALQNSPFTGRNGSQSKYFPSLPDVVSGQIDRVELKMERVGRPDEAMNYGLSGGKGLDTFNGRVESMKFTPSGETCVK